MNTFWFQSDREHYVLRELTHTEVIWTSSLQVCTSDFTTDFMFYTDKGEQQSNPLCICQNRIYFIVYKQLDLIHPDYVVSYTRKKEEKRVQDAVI